jgi:hypothetical protein
MITGYYYLHVNKDLIYKRGEDAILDIERSDLCQLAWPWDGTRGMAWCILVQASASGAKEERIKELSEKWNCNNEDAPNYATRVGLEIGKDGDSYFARSKDFIDLQQSPCGFGKSYLEAMVELTKQQKTLNFNHKNGN